MTLVRKSRRSQTRPLLPVNAWAVHQDELAGVPRLVAEAPGGDHSVHGEVQFLTRCSSRIIQPTKLGTKAPCTSMVCTCTCHCTCVCSTPAQSDFCIPHDSPSKTQRCTFRLNKTPSLKLTGITAKTYTASWMWTCNCWSLLGQPGAHSSGQLQPAGQHLEFLAQSGKTTNKALIPPWQAHAHRPLYCSLNVLVRALMDGRDVPLGGPHARPGSSYCVWCWTLQNALSVP